MVVKTKKTTVVIVGRPNVGKSTLFNRIIGRQEAIVDDQPGVTRDAKYRKADWNGKTFDLVDTGGFFGPDEDPLTPFVQERIERTARHASLFLFLLDGRSGPTPLDHEVLDRLRRMDAPIIGVVNKIDNFSNVDQILSEYYELGLDSFVPVSALQGLGIGDLLDEVVEFLPESEGDEEEVPIYPGIAIIGRPNVGKSTLLNSLCGDDKSIVSSIPGTTRDPVDTEILYNERHYLLIDTAGIRRKGKMSRGVERYSLKRMEQTLERCDLALLMIDAVEGLTETDAKVFGMAHNAGKAAIILVNKWDAVEKDGQTSGAYAKDIKAEVPFLHYAPIEFISAMTKQRMHRIFPQIERILEYYYHRVPTSHLNDLLEKILDKHPPSVHKGRVPRIYYWTQVGTGPPTFVAFASDPKSIHFSYQRYLINQLYKTFQFEGTPLRLLIKKRGKQKT